MKNNKQLNEINENFLQSLPSPDDKWPINVKRTFNIIHSCLFKEYLTIAYIRNKCCIRDNNFSGCFKHFVGRTPKDYILFLRISCSKKILKSQAAENISMADISFSVGFSSQAAFSACFNKRVKYSPSDWQKKIKKNLKI